MFGIGILTVKYLDKILKHVNYFYIFGFVCIVSNFLSLPGFQSSGNNLGIFYFISYVGFMIWIAFGLRKIPLRFDLSYGIYVWHMPVINMLIVMDLNNPLIALIIIILASAVSWYFVERPALKLKNQTLRRFV
jgi:peptidoglycan/LPS O-acetylase OafA/YrhL